MDDPQISNDELLKKKVVFGSIVFLVGLVCTVIVQLGRLA